MRVNRAATFACMLGCVIALGALVPAPANAGLWPDHVIWVDLKNNTGVNVNDVHLNLLHRISKTSGPGDFGSTKFSNVAFFNGNPFTLDLSGADAIRPGVVAPGGSAGVGWWSNFPSDTNVTGHWTNNGVQQGGQFQVGNAEEAFNIQDNGNGTVTVALENNGTTPVGYSGLQVYKDAPWSSFTAGDAYADMTSGTSVSLLVPSSGILAPGTMTVATFTPSEFTYFAQSVSIDGDIMAVASAIPEPGGTIMVLSAALCFITRRRK